MDVGKRVAKIPFSSKFGTRRLYLYKGPEKREFKQAMNLKTYDPNILSGFQALRYRFQNK